MLVLCFFQGETKSCPWKKTTCIKMQMLCGFHLILHPAPFISKAGISLSECSKNATCRTYMTTYGMRTVLFSILCLVFCVINRTENTYV
uniref:Uncharacterized protein n=1 Tax=Pyxicephalus adspersus TaxID=30357 RepID=A0AAV3ASN4_PYXAD|nr:TPA: hypothetical protein GDO54_007715 [Pyxicephalus adspersus]